MKKVRKTNIENIVALVVLSVGIISTPSEVLAGIIPPCGLPECTTDFYVEFNDSEIGGGELIYNEMTGDLVINYDSGLYGDVSVDLDGVITWTMEDGETLSLNSLGGNVDPLINFGLGASTGSDGAAFGFTFNLPIALSGQIDASSSVAYTLTAASSAGAQIAPIVGDNIVTAYEIDTSVDGLGSLNKGVDVGSTFFFTDGPETNTSDVFTASNSFIGDLAYDIMAVKIDFALSANSSVGVSGFVEQTSVPVPAAFWLLSTGMIGVIGLRKRNR